MMMTLAFYAVFTPASTLLGSCLAETLRWNDYLVTGINMLLNLTLEYLYDTFIVYRGEMDNNDLAASESGITAYEICAKKGSKN